MHILDVSQTSICLCLDVSRSNFLDKVQVCGGRRQTEEVYNGRWQVWVSLVSLHWQQTKKGMIIFFVCLFFAHCACLMVIIKIFWNSWRNSFQVLYVHFTFLNGYILIYILCSDILLYIIYMYFCTHEKFVRQMTVECQRMA